MPCMEVRYSLLYYVLLPVYITYILIAWHCQTSTFLLGGWQTNTTRNGLPTSILTYAVYLKTLAGENIDEFSYLDYLEEKFLVNGLQIYY